MKTKTLYALWAASFILCAGLGFIPEPEGAAQALLTVLSLLFFLPPFLLLRVGNKDTAALVRNLSLLSLGMTAVLLVLNFLCAFRSEFLGELLHVVLTVVSAPMIASGCWVVSLFLWACLWLVSRKKRK